MSIPPMLIPPIALGVALDEGMVMLMVMSMAVEVAIDPISMALVANRVQEQATDLCDQN